MAEPERRTDVDGDSEMVDSSSNLVPKDAPSIDVDHRRTDHERHQGSGAFPTATSAPTPIPGAKALYKLSTARKYFHPFPLPCIFPSITSLSPKHPWLNAFSAP